MNPIVHIISDTGIGGGGRSLINLLACCDRKQFPPAVILPRYSALIPQIAPLDLPIYEIDAMVDKSMDFSAIAPLTKLLKELNPTLVHTHGSLSGRIAARLAGKKVVYTKHCAFPPSGIMASPPVKLVHRLMEYALSDGVIAVGHSAEEVLLATGIPQSHIHVMYTGVTPLSKLDGAKRETLRSEMGFAPDRFVVGMLARAEVYKGHRTLLEAAAQLVEEGYPIRLLIVGDGDLLQQLKFEAALLPEGAVHFTGFTTQVAEMLSAMDVQVNASYESETSSLSLLEGMSMGLPAVVSDCGGNPHLITDGKNGLVFPAQDVAGLAHCLSQLMDSPETLAQMACCATAIFEERFTAQVYAKNIEAVYADVLNRKF